MIAASRVRRIELHLLLGLGWRGDWGLCRSTIEAIHVEIATDRGARTPNRLDGAVILRSPHCQRGSHARQLHTSFGELQGTPAKVAPSQCGEAVHLHTKVLVTCQAGSTLVSCFIASIK